MAVPSSSSSAVVVFVEQPLGPFGPLPPPTDKEEVLATQTALFDSEMCLLYIYSCMCVCILASINTRHTFQEVE